MSRENHIYEPDWSGRTDQLCSVNKPVIKKDALALVMKIGKSYYLVHGHFSNTSTESMSDKIKRMLKNVIQQM